MKPVIRTDKNIISTLDGERITMAFDETALAHLQNMYINIYEDREMAVLREYSCNAFDAHVEAGNQDPILVTLPTRFNPVLKIVDHGIGLGLEDMREIYSKYGASTKRESDDVIGSFGIGCKSALTYTDQFTIESRKDGREVIVSVARNSEGIGELTIVSDEATDEPNGVTITIPCSAYNTFAQKAQKLFQYWPKGSVLVDGQEPAHFTENQNIKRLVGDIYIDSTSQDYYNQEKSVVVMGNVAYPVTHEALGLNFNTDRYNDRPKYHRIIAIVPIGTVEPVPAREGLTSTSDNEKALKAIGQTVKDNVEDLITTEVDKASSFPEAIKVVNEVKRYYPAVFWPEAWQLKGEDIPLTVEAVTEMETVERDEDGSWIPYSKQKTTGGFVVVRRSESGKNHNRTKSLKWEHVIDCIYFTGFTLDRFGAHHRRRLNQWINNQYEAGNSDPSQVTFYVLTDKLPEHDLIDTSKVYDWEDVRQTKLPINHSGGGSSAAYDSIDGLSRQVTKVSADEIDEDAPIFYYCELESATYDRWGDVVRGTSRAEAALPFARIIKNEHSDAQFFCLPPTREAKFQRLFPEAREMREVVKEMAERWAKKLTAKERQRLALREQGIDGVYQQLSPFADRLDDAELVGHVQVVTTLQAEDLLSAYRQFQQNVVGFDTEILKLDSQTDYLQRYPLLKDPYYGDIKVSEHNQDHVVVYLNAAYSQFHATTSTN